MSKYEEELSEEGYICPYCKSCDEDGTYNYKNEVVECKECRKKFIATAESTITFYSTPDCKINGEEHDFVYVPGFKVNYCIKCGFMESKK